MRAYGSCRAVFPRIPGGWLPNPPTGRPCPPIGKPFRGEPGRANGRRQLALATGRKHNLGLTPNRLTSLQEVSAMNSLSISAWVRRARVLPVLVACWPSAVARTHGRGERRRHVQRRTPALGNRGVYERGPSNGKIDPDSENPRPRAAITYRRWRAGTCGSVCKHLRPGRAG